MQVLTRSLVTSSFFILHYVLQVFLWAHTCSSYIAGLELPTLEFSSRSAGFCDFRFCSLRWWQSRVAVEEVA